MIAPQQVQEWILQSADPSSPEQQAMAGDCLQRFSSMDTVTVSTVLIDLLSLSEQHCVVFYALSTLERLPIDSQRQMQLRRYLLQPRSSSWPSFIDNKAALILAKQQLITAAASDEDVSWNELLALATNLPILYCKTLSTLLEELVMEDPSSVELRRHVKHRLKGYNYDQQELQKNGGQSPTLLERLLDRLVAILDEALASSSSDTALAALAAVQACWAWTDLAHFSDALANRLLALLLDALHPHCSAEIQQAALQAWQEWMTASSSTQAESSRTASSDKLPVMEALCHRLHEYNLLPYQGESSANDIAVVIAVAKVVATMGDCLIGVDDAPVAARVWDLCWRALRYDDIDVSAAVLALAGRLAGEETYVAQHVPQLLNIVYQQVKYPEDFGYDYEDEDDAEEEVYRTELIKLFGKLVRAAPSTCLQFVGEATAQLLPNVAAAPTSDVHATLRLLYHYCENIRPPPGMKTALANETLVSLLKALHESNVVNHGHREVLIVYYDVAVRYYPVFETEPALLSKVLAALTGTTGLQHVHARVRSRCCYLLLRLVKSLASLMRPYVETAVGGIQGLLSNAEFALRPDDTLYLFETMGLLLGKTGVDEAQQQRYLTELMTPHVRRIDQILATPGLSRDVEHFGEILAGSIAAMAHLSKGFARPCDGVRVVLMETVHVTLRVLKALPTSEPVRNKAMVLIQRMIQCLGSQVLSTIPEYLYLLINHCTADDILFVSQMFNQLCMKFKSDAIPVIDDALLPFLRKCHSLVPTPEEDTESGLPPHLRTEQLSIQKLSFAVLQYIVSNNATPVLLTPANVGSLETVLQTMCEGAVYVNDPVIKRTCTKFFRELLDQWASPAPNGEDVYRRGFVAFVAQTFVPLMLENILSPGLDERDAMHARNVGEFAQILWLLRSQKDSVYQQVVVSGWSASGRVPPDVLAALSSASSVSTVEDCLQELLKRKRAAS